MSTYTGHVEPDGEWQDRRDGRLLVRKLSVEAMDNDVYVVADAETRRAVLIDAAARPERLREAIEGFDVLAVLQTHGHWDHVRAWEALRDEDGIEVWGQPGDADLFPRAPDRELAHGDRIDLGGVTVEVLHTPGHTPGSCQYLVEADQRPHLFSGDSLFPGGLGNTFGDEGAFEQLYGEVTTKVFDRLPDETWVYPGHGDDTTLGSERPHLREWYERRW
jgi:glyoxylase-like metal-dependent hydrolase (beta-lactamase superfamily II)